MKNARKDIQKEKSVKKKIDKLTDLQGQLIAVEMEMSSLDNEIKRMEMELNYCKHMITMRKDNLKLLKKPDVICILKSYGLSKTELAYFEEKYEAEQKEIRNKKNEMKIYETKYMNLLKEYDTEAKRKEAEQSVLTFRGKNV
jgi:chromosome segregation ATPase